MSQTGLAGLQINSGVTGAAEASLLFNLQAQVNDIYAKMTFNDSNSVGEDIVYDVIYEDGCVDQIVLQRAGDDFVGFCGCGCGDYYDW